MKYMYGMLKQEHQNLIIREQIMKNSMFTLFKNNIILKQVNNLGVSNSFSMFDVGSSHCVLLEPLNFPMKCILTVHHFIHFANVSLS